MIEKVEGSKISEKFCFKETEVCMSKVIYQKFSKSSIGRILPLEA